MTKKKETQKPTKSLSQSKINRLENGNLEIEITIPQKVVAEAYQKALKKLASSVKIKGFRPGKAPAKMVEKTLGKEKVYQEMAQDLLTQVYLEALQTHKIIPLVNPKLNLISSEEGKDWQVKATTAELPEVNLGDYKSKLQKEFAAAKIWVPGKDGKSEEETPEKQEEKIKKIFQALLETIKIKVPALLIEEEINRMLSRLIDQTARLGLTVEQYLASINKTAAEIRTEYQKQAEESIRLELILSAIANQEKIKVEEKDVEKMIAAAGDEKIRQNLRQPAQIAYIRQVLRKRQVIDMLAKL